jgi:hypothetical protein
VWSDQNSRDAELQLEIDDIQGDIVVGLQKNFELFMERPYDCIEPTFKKESASPNYSIPSACFWALQSKERSIRRVSASTVRSFPGALLLAANFPWHRFAAVLTGPSFC